MAQKSLFYPLLYLCGRFARMVRRLNTSGAEA